MCLGDAGAEKKNRWGKRTKCGEGSEEETGLFKGPRIRREWKKMFSDGANGPRGEYEEKTKGGVFGGDAM